MPKGKSVANKYRFVLEEIEVVAKGKSLTKRY
jgi:hypothetical protein